MAERAALITGASRGIGRALAELLGEEGYALTISARRPEGVQQAAAELRDKGFAVESLAANVANEDELIRLAGVHRERYGRLDVLVNNAGIGIGAAAAEHQTKLIDLQLAVNVRAMIILYRECLELLRAAGREHRSALVVNLASIAGKSPQPWLSVYSTCKAAVVAYTQAMNKELGAEGIKSAAFCPGFVDTDMTEFVKGSVPAEEMISTSDVAEALRFLLRVSPQCVIPEIIFQRPAETV